MIYLVGAYLIFWAGVLAYLLIVGSRLRALARRVEELKEELEEEDARR